MTPSRGWWPPATRAPPVYRGDLDDIIGIVHLRALLAGSGSIGDRGQPALVMPETVGALDALRTMQTTRQQMAVVINEHGGTEGVITVEDLIEELVGEIWDEADPDVQAVEHHPDRSITVVGWRLQVLEVTERRIQRVRLTRVAADTPSTDPRP